jgi:1-deoxy-D-xylulose-5-phosphate reductoisomerase
MVEYNDGAIKAELGVPSMRIPISYALYKEKRPDINEKCLDFNSLKKLSIDKPDLETFEGLKLAYDALKIGGLMPAVYNALNEVAVYKFLNKEKKSDGKTFSYLDIVKFIKHGMKKFKNKKKYNIDDIEKTMKYAKNINY